MPLYSLQCPVCDAIDEHFMGVSDRWKAVECAECGAGMTRGSHRAYHVDRPMISGDTVAGGCKMSDYYDEGMDEYVTSRSHRKDLMEQKGLEEYSPDPEMKKHRDEAKYILNDAPRGDQEAGAAARAELKTAADKRTEKQVADSFRKAGI